MAQRFDISSLPMGGMDPCKQLLSNEHPTYKTRFRNAARPTTSNDTTVERLVIFRLDNKINTQSKAWNTHFWMFFKPELGAFFVYNNFTCVLAQPTGWTSARWFAGCIFNCKFEIKQRGEAIWHWHCSAGVIDHVNYVVASNLYAGNENWGHVVDARMEMGTKKEMSRCGTAVSYGTLKSMMKKIQKASLLHGTSNFSYFTTMRYAWKYKFYCHYY